MRSFGEMIEWKMLSNGLKNNDIKKIFQPFIYIGNGFWDEFIDDINNHFY